MAEQISNDQQDEFIAEMRKQLKFQKENQEKLIKFQQEQTDSIKRLNDLFDKQQTELSHLKISKGEEKQRNDQLFMDNLCIVQEYQQKIKQKDETIMMLKMKLSGALGGTKNKHYENDELKRQIKELKQQLTKSWEKIERVVDSHTDLVTENHDLREEIANLKRNNDTNNNNNSK